MKIGRYLMGVVGSALIATSAIAADLPPTPTVMAPPAPMAAPAFDWSGMYFGVDIATAAAPISIGGHVGFNIQRGRTVFGLEGGVGVVVAGPVFNAYLKGRAGFVVGQRALLYGMVSINTFFVPGPPVFWVAGGGAEFAINDRMSIFGEAGVLGVFNPFGCCGVAIRAGLNIHR